ncbi:MAG: hypothetical protein AB7F79_02825 [Steroidobacteraceae bacterium]
MTCNVRSSRNALTEALVGSTMSIRRTVKPVVGATDVMFYFIGAVQVPGLTSNRIRPDAVADHLTSIGGALLDTAQMSSLRWLEAGRYRQLRHCG